MITMFERVRLVICVISVIGLTACKDQVRSIEKGVDESRLSDLAKSLPQSVVSIESVSEGGKKVKTGTGFFVSGDGIVATCAHLVDGAKTIRVKTMTGAEYKFQGVKEIDLDKDLALLLVSAEGVAPFSSTDTSSITVGTQIAVFGNPLNFKGTFTEGVVSAIREPQGKRGRLIQISAPISPGSSGSPAINLKGQLVGMVTSGAKDGEGIGFVIPAEFIWRAVERGDGDNIKKDLDEEVDVFRDSLSKSSKRYLPSKELRDDPVWKNAQFPENPAQRLVVLRRLANRYPNDAVLRIAIAADLSSDNRDDEAFEVLAKLIKGDPGNRLALSYMETRGSAKKRLPYFEGAIKADPLNFRARQYLYGTKTIKDQFMDAMYDARTAAKIAPFFLRIKDEYADSLGDYELSVSRLRRSSIKDYSSSLLSIRLAIEEANKLRGITVLAAQVLVNPDEESVGKFLVAARANPKESFAYAWELMHKNRVEYLLSQNSLDELKKFVRNTQSKYPLEAEAYLLDDAAVRKKFGLLKYAIRVGPFSVMDYKAPWGIFNKVAMYSLCKRAYQKELGGFPLSPEQIILWKKALDEHIRTAMALANENSSFDAKVEKWTDQIMFQFWLALYKERFNGLLKKDKIGEDEKVSLRKAMDVLKDIPSKQEAAYRVRDAVKKVADKGSGGSYWNYYVRGEYIDMDSLSSAFEQAAR